MTTKINFVVELSSVDKIDIYHISANAKSP